MSLIADLVAGQKILFGVEDSFRVGDLTYINQELGMVRFNDITDVNSNSERGEECYYAPEIQSIRVLDSVVDRALTRIKIHVFINQMDGLYHEALKYIRLQPEFGVHMESIENGRHSEFPSLLTIVTFRCIFIFDILWFTIPKDLEELLTSDSYRRVIHDGRMLKDVLLYRFGITLGKCFDTLVAHIASKKAAKPDVKVNLPSIDISIQDLVKETFKLPDKFFREGVDFAKRTLPIEDQVEAAKNAAFLLDLQNHLVSKVLLADLFKRATV